MSRSGKAKLNVVVMIFYELVSLICGLILPRLILSAFGSSYNGTIASISKFLTFINVLNIGIAGSTRVALYQSLADGDLEKTSGIVKCHQNQMRKVAYILIAYIVVLCFAFPYIIDSSLEKIQVAVLVIILGISSFAQYFFGTTSYTLLFSDQKGYIYYFLQSIALIVNTLVGFILIKLHCDIFIVKLGSAVVFFISPVILSIIVKKMYHLNSKAKPDYTAIKQRGAVVASSIADTVHYNVDISVLTLFTNAKVVSVYAIYNIVTNGIDKIMQVFTKGIESSFGNMFAKKENTVAKQNLEKFIFFICCMICVIFSCAFVLILPFISLYTKNITDIDYVLPTFAFLSLLAILTFCIRQPFVLLVQAAGKYKETKNGAIIEAVLNLVLSVASVLILGNKYGYEWSLIGVTLGTIVANIFRTTQYIVFCYKQLLPGNVKYIFLVLLWTFLNLVIMYFLNKFCISFIVFNSWLDWLVAGIICFAISSIFTFLSGFICFNKKMKELLKFAFKNSSKSNKIVKKDL